MVTGATAGIGRAFADALAVDHDLVLVARDEPRLAEVGAQLRARHGGAVRAVSADLASGEGVQTAAQLVTGLGHALRLLVNNAGHGSGRRFADNDIAAEDAMLDVMVRAPMHLCHAALRAYLAPPHPGGAVVNVSSVAGFLPRGTYGAHKAWVTSFSRWADLEYRQRGARFMALCPGFVRTEFHQRMGVTTDSVPSWMWLDADDLVVRALRDLRSGRTVSIPSRRYQLLTGAARVVPARALHRTGRLGRRQREVR